LANKNELNRQKAVAYFKRQIETVRTVGGDYLIVVPSAVGKSAPMGRDPAEGRTSQIMSGYAKESLAKLKEWFA
jgi:sugar phosphate isomerase/epimerase